MNTFLDVLATIGRALLDACRVAGALRCSARPACRTSCGRPSTARLFGRAMLEIGYFSLPVVALTAIFTGMVLALQSYTGFSRFSAESAIANLVVLSVTRELGPVLAGLMVAGRIGAAMAAEIGTMRVTDQIDALSHAVDQSDEISGGAAAARRASSRCRCWWWSPTSSACWAASSSPP